MTSPIVNRAAAHKQPKHHQFVPGLGYIAHDAPPDLPPGANGSKNCAPAPGTKDGTPHDLRVPGGAQTMALVWREGAWHSPTLGKGNRLAWDPAHLSRAGWEYVGPAAEAAAPAKGGRGKRAG